MQLAPIILFAYNRPHHFKETLVALSNNVLAKKSILYIFIDGPKNMQDVRKIKDIEITIDKTNKNSFLKIIVVKSKKNKGLAQSIVCGINKIINKYGKVIVLEDDIVTSKFFLRYMNLALNTYVDDKKVFHINGYSYPHTKKLPESFFLQHASSWGWATWQDRWAKYEDDSNVLLKKMRAKSGAVSAMNLDNVFNFFSTLKANARGMIKTWAIKWQATIILNNGLCLFPGTSLVENTGNDGSGENSKQNTFFDTHKSDYENNFEKIPIKVSKKAMLETQNFFKKIRPTFLKRIRNFIIFNIKNR